MTTTTKTEALKQLRGTIPAIPATWALTQAIDAFEAGGEYRDVLVLAQAAVGHLDDEQADAFSAALDEASRALGHGELFDQLYCPMDEIRADMKEMGLLR